MIVIDERRLTRVAEIAAGSVRTVTHVRCTDPRLPADMAFTALRPGADPTRSRGLLDRLHDLVGLRDAMPPSDLAELDSLTIWPLAMVARDDRLVGGLTRTVDRDYFLETRPPGGPPALRLFDLRLLCVPADRLRTLGIARSPVADDLVRLALMARLAYAIEVIHRPRGGRRLVYGDLCLGNVAVALGPPRVMLMDCEDVADVGDAARRQRNTPFFVPPELLNKQQILQDQVTDVYKLALCVIRSLATGRGATQLADPASPLVRPGLLDQAGIDLLGRAVSADRDRRPTAEEIKDYLIGRVLHLAERPRVAPR